MSLNSSSTATSEALVVDHLVAPQEHLHVQKRPHEKLPVGESVARGALALLSTQPITWAGSLMTTIVAPRLLGAEALGQFTIAVTIATIASSVTNLGISEYLVRRVAQRPASFGRDIGAALLLETVIAFLSLGVLAVLVPLGVLPVTDTRLLYVAYIAVLVYPAQTVLLSSFRGREMHAQYAWYNAASVVVGQLLGVVALLLGADVLAYTAIVTLSTVAVTAAAWVGFALGPTWPRFDRELIVHDWAEFIRGGFAFWIGTLTVGITNGIDRVILGAFVSGSEVGWYAAAWRIIGIPIFIPTLIITPLFPALSRSTHDPDTIRATVAKTLRMTLLLMVPLAAGTIVIAPAVPGLLGWPADFENAVPLMQVLAAQLPLVAVDMVLGVVLMAIGRQNPWMLVGLSALALKISLNLLAIPVFDQDFGSGAVGSSYVTIIAELVMLAGALILIPKHLLELRTLGEALRIVLIGLLVIVVGSLLLKVNLAAAILGGSLTYFTAGAIVRMLTFDDILLARSLISRPRRR